MTNPDIFAGAGRVRARIERRDSLDAGYDEQ